MNIVQVRKLVVKDLDRYKSQTQYAEFHGINKSKLSEFLSGKIDYVPSSLLNALGMEAIPQPTIYKVKKNG